MENWRKTAVNGQYTGQGPSSPQETPVVRIDLGLTGRQILLALGGLATILTSGLSAGYIFLPAKDADLQVLRTVVEKVSTDVGNMTKAVEGLTAAVERIQQQPPRVIERVITRRIPRATGPAPR